MFSQDMYSFHQNNTTIKNGFIITAKHYQHPWAPLLMIFKSLLKPVQISRLVRSPSDLGKPPSFYDPYAPPPKKKAFEPFSIDTITKERASYFINSVGTKHSKPYQKIVDDLIALHKRGKLTIPPKPEQWLQKPGWYRYTTDSPPQKVEFPKEDFLVFDVERLYNISQYPTMATACSQTAWYGWVSEYIADDKSQNPKDMIPLNPKNKRKIVVGHNVSFDRSLVGDEYDLSSKASKTFYIDTMGVYVQGLPYYTTEDLREKNVFEPFIEPYFKENEARYLHSRDNRKGLTLKALYERYFKKTLNKEVRSEFDTEDKKKIIKRFNKLMDYCADDVVATFQLFLRLYPSFQKHIVSPSQLIGLKELGNSKVIVDSEKWKAMYDDNDRAMNKSLDIARETLKEIAQSKNTALPRIPALSSHVIKDLLDVSFNPSYLPKQLKVEFDKVVPHSKTLLYKRLYSLWLDGTFKPTTPKSAKFIKETFKPMFWKYTKDRLAGTPVIPSEKENYSVILPMVKTINTPDLLPNEPFWLSSTPSNPEFESIAQPVSQYFNVPEGMSQVSLPLNKEFLKSLIDRQDLTKVSPYLSRQHLNQLQMEYIYDILACTIELFHHFKILDYHLLTTYNKSLSFVIPKEQGEIGQLALEIASFWVDLAISHQTKLKATHHTEEFVSDLKSRSETLLKRFPRIGFEFVRLNFKDFKYNKFTQLGQLQNYLDSIADRSQKKSMKETA